MSTVTRGIYASRPTRRRSGAPPHRLSVDHRQEIQAQLDDDRDRQTHELFAENDAFQSEGTVAGSLSISRWDAEDRLQRLVERGVIGRKPSGYGTYNRHYAID
ncbi:hypothetical protein NWP13_22105 [Rhodococcus pyridinivorans]|nr:hypothetical protein [Rhodococcus pyridinivorans]